MFYFKAKRLICLITTSLITLSGCVSENYPADWPPLKPEGSFANACPVISGRYKAISLPSEGYNECHNSIGKYGYCRSLPQELLGISVEPTISTWVNIDQKDTTQLDITIGDGDTVVYRGILRGDKKEFSCHDNMLFLKQDENAPVTGGTLAKYYYEKIFQKAADGSLVMQEVASTAGFTVFVIPVVASSKEWYRWLPARKSN